MGKLVSNYLAIYISRSLWPLQKGNSTTYFDLLVSGLKMDFDLLELEVELTSFLQLLVLANGLQFLLGVSRGQNLLRLLLQLLLINSIQFLGLILEIVLGPFLL